MDDTSTGEQPAVPAEVPISEEDRRLLAAWAADCAERALARYESAVPGDARPRAAIAAARAYARDGRRTGQLRAAGWAALAAAKETDAPAASAAARAAGCAAAAPYIHPLATPHQVNHVLSPGLYAARAAEAARPGAAEAELDRAVELAPAAVRALVRRLPPPGGAGRTRLDALRHRFAAALRA
ncbi:hypothetical protein CFP65_1271 [Kitasatospora sp. MMS16-BH015]|uniref:putative immunity protein n=1 Tax=Kitasatospora sp. MMS16-BH015 TaxID=2018025 RepID=UPI000CA0E48A|nr:hypothetical protein [Kitasatospora sp. MMS16-BH015]AUG76172.1 hypothetical protein CFP65_1271 [Kitasatospora sp. MMS16-BH015]